MKALVTGATGLAGYHLVNRLLDDNYTVTALGRDQKMLDELEQMGAEPLQFDLTSDNNRFDILDKYADYVWFHLAAAIAGASHERLDEVNINGTRKLVGKAEALNIPRIILVSSTSTYGTKLIGKIQEDVTQIPESYYGHSKLQQEQIVKNSSIPHTIVRPPYIGGPKDLNFLMEFATRVLDSNLPTFSRDGIISYVDARDLAKGLLCVASTEKSKNSCYNIISDTIMHSELQVLLGKKLDVDPPYGKHYPYWLAMIVGFLGEIKAKITGKSAQRGASRYRIRTLCRQFQLDASNLNALGYSPEFTVEQSIEDWLQEKPFFDSDSDNI